MMSASISRIALLLFMAGIVMGSLCARGNKGKDGENAVSEVAATVGSEEISVQPINQVLSRAKAPGTAFQAGPVMRYEILEKLIDQQLAVDQAVDSRLHRLPEVVAQMEAARRDILTRAYIGQFASTLPKPMPEDVKKHYAENPRLFSEWRIFNVHEIDAALPLIEFFLSNQRAAEAVASNIKQLRANSKIAYFDAFANTERTLLGVDKSKTVIEKSVTVAK